MADAKTCSKCKAAKPLSEFYRVKSQRRKSQLGLSYSICKKCCVEKVKAYQAKHLVRIHEYKRQHYQKLKAKGLANWNYEDRMYRRLYDSNKQAYDLQLAGQNGRCAICNRLQAGGERRFPFDHDHENGLTRGVLCTACNGGLGCFRDDPELLKAALSYLVCWAVEHRRRVAQNE